MNFSRDFTLTIAKILDNWIPPIIRDSEYFVYLPFKFLFKDKTHLFLTFKDLASHLSESEYLDLYKEVDPYLIERETSLNNICIKAILRATTGHRVLEVGCGKAFLANKLAEKFAVTGVDILVDDITKRKNRNLKLINANVEHLPFRDSEFDTTICTHTLEHVQNFEEAVRELRRVTKKRLIIVVPMQRPYKYTFDLHLRFFPFPSIFLIYMKAIERPPKEIICKDLGGDIFYYEDR